MQQDSYNSMAKFLHWSLALLIAGNFILGLTLSQSKLYDLHKQVGLTILLLVILRILWRFLSYYPKPLSSLSSLDRMLSKIVHILLYILMLAIPVCGILMVEGYGHSLKLWNIIPVPNLIISKIHINTLHLLSKLHLYLACLIIVIAIFHIIAALWHHFFKKNNILNRMSPFKNKT